MRKRRKLPFLYWVLTYLPIALILFGSVFVYIENWRIGLGLFTIALGFGMVKLTSSTLKEIRNRHRNG